MTNQINTLLKCGMEIINTFKGSRSPVLDMIIDMLQRFSQQNGADGVKRIVLILFYFLRAVSDDEDHIPKDYK